MAIKIQCLYTIILNLNILHLKEHCHHFGGHKFRNTFYIYIHYYKWIEIDDIIILFYHKKSDKQCHNVIHHKSEYRLKTQLNYFLF